MNKCINCINHYKGYCLRNRKAINYIDPNTREYKQFIIGELTCSRERVCGYRETFLPKEYVKVLERNRCGKGGRYFEPK